MLVDVPFDAQRTVHTLDPVGKAFYRHLLIEGSPPSPTMNEYGYLKGRRREAAIKQQLVVADRLAANGISSDTNSFDMKNAFASMSFEVLDKGLASSFKTEDLHFV